MVGPLPPDTDWALRAFLERPVDIVRPPAAPNAFRTALDRAGRAGPGERIVLGLQLPSRVRSISRGSTSSPTGTYDAAAVAFWFDGEGTDSADPFPGPSARVRGVVSTAVSGVRRTYGAAGPPVGSGPWTPPFPPAPTVDGNAFRDFANASTARVSEGAYVPRPRYVENLASRWNFAAERCSSCGATNFPVRGKCRSCGHTDTLVRVNLPRDDARVVATTVIGPGGQPTEFDPQVAALGPYEVVLAELVDGVRVTLQVADATPGEVRIGDRVDTRLRRLFPMDGEWRYGRKAVPRGRS